MSVLMVAAETGSVEAVEAFLKTVAVAFPDTKHSVSILKLLVRFRQLYLYLGLLTHVYSRMSFPRPVQMMWF